MVKIGEWKNERTTDHKNEQKNERTKERTNKRTNEQKKKRTKEQTNKRTDERVTGRTAEQQTADIYRKCIVVLMGHCHRESGLFSFPMGLQQESTKEDLYSLAYESVVYTVKILLYGLPNFLSFLLSRRLLLTEACDCSIPLGEEIR